MARTASIVFGEVNCFIKGTSATRQIFSKSDDSHLETKRFVVIHQEAGGTKCYISFYKNESKYHKDKPKFRDELDVQKCCGVARGNIGGHAGKKGKNEKCGMYLALIFMDFTVMLISSGDDNSTKITVSDLEKRCSQLFGHVKTKQVLLDSAPTSVITKDLHPGSHVLLSLTRDRISFSSVGNYHRLCQSWPIDDVCLLVDPFMDESDYLAIKVHRFGAYHFRRTSNSDILLDVKEEVKRSMERRRDEMHPYHVSHSHDHVTRGSANKRPSCVRWSNGHKVQNIPRSTEPLPDLVPSDAPGGTPVFYLDEDVNADVGYGEYITTCMQELSRIYENYLQHEPKPDSEDFDCDLNEIAIEYRNDVPETYTDMYLTTEYKPGQKNSHDCNTLPARRTSHPTMNFDSHPKALLNRRMSCRELGLRDTNPQHSMSRLDESVRLSDGKADERLSESMENPIFRTIERVLKGVPPHKDTLGLTRKQRGMLCLCLYLPCSETAGTSEGSWVILAEHIGLRMEAIELISRIVSNHRLAVPAAEIVLRHWQHMFNKYGPTEPSGKCPYKCSKENLLFIIRDKMGRKDLAEIIEA